MHRRRFLATAAAAVAGCVGTGVGPTRVGGPAEWLEDDGAEKHLRFDAAAIGAGTLTLETVVRPIGRLPEEVGLRAEVDLSTGGAFGRRFVLSATTRLAPVRRSDDASSSWTEPLKAVTHDPRSSPGRTAHGT